jgi:hypothetical protein
VKPATFLDVRFAPQFRTFRLFLRTPKSGPTALLRH